MISETILRYGEPVLRHRADEVPEFNDEVQGIINRMHEVLEASGGIGLAGPQVGLGLRIFVYRLSEEDTFHALVNPKIVKSFGEETGLEGCLSIPGLHGEVSRSAGVTVVGLDETGQHVRIRATGLKARMYQHEIDHLNGILFVDKADPSTLELDSADDQEEQVI